jgi:methionyl-tRNA formyltransferase
VSKWNPEAFLVVGWYHMIPKRWRELAPAYGLHASLLPDYSGGAPLVWAMINGESETGITLFKMDSGVDSGPVVGQKSEPIWNDDTIATLYERIESRGIELIERYLPLLASGSVKLKFQDESKRRVVPQRGPEDGLINWNEKAVKISRFIRAQTHPYPGAFTLLNGKKLHIWQAEVVEGSVLKDDIGCVQRNVDDGSYSVVCYRNKIMPKVVEYEGVNYEQGQLQQLFQGGGQVLGI